MTARNAARRSADEDEDERMSELAALAKALAHPARLRILRLLIARNACVCGSIVGELPLAQSTVSEHLRVLRSAGLVRGEVDGPRVCYCADPAAFARLRGLIDQLTEGFDVTGAGRGGYG